MITELLAIAFHRSDWSAYILGIKVSELGAHDGIDFFAARATQVSRSKNAHIKGDPRGLVLFRSGACRRSHPVSVS